MTKNIEDKFDNGKLKTYPVYKENNKKISYIKLTNYGIIKVSDELEAVNLLNKYEKKLGNEYQFNYNQKERVIEYEKIKNSAQKDYVGIVQKNLSDGSFEKTFNESYEAVLELTKGKRKGCGVIRTKPSPFVGPGGRNRPDPKRRIG